MKESKVACGCRFFDAVLDLAIRLRSALFPVVVPPAQTTIYIQSPANTGVNTSPAMPTDGFYIGKSSDGGKPVIASSELLDRHVLIVGSTGCGKTTLIDRFFEEEILKWR